MTSSAPAAKKPRTMRGSSPLPSTTFPELDNERIQIFRGAYRKFRTGEAYGAKGEASSLTHEGARESLPPVDEEKLREETFYTSAPNDAILQEVTDYRLAYQRFRLGSSQGAKGEVSSVARTMSKKHARFMPAAQRSAMMTSKAAAMTAAPRPVTAFHVHFGGGRLGLGLLSPAIAKAHADGIPFALVDAPFGDYEALCYRGHEIVNFFVNGEPSIQSVRLVTKASDLPADLLDRETRLFVCTLDAELVGKVVAQATTVSTSLGPVLPKVIMPHFQKPNSGKFIYCCENDHGMVEDLEKTMEASARVVTCMVDRICTGREVKGADIFTTAEPDRGEVVILNAPDSAPLPAFRGENIMCPASEAEASYFCRRKITVVNGSHTTLAFLTLCRNETGNVAKDHPLMTYETASPSDQQVIWQWAVGRLLLILYEHDLEVIKSAHGVETDQEVCDILIAYARKTLQRFNTIKDTTSRVLAGGVANRWNTRLNTLLTYLNSHAKLSGGIAGMLLRRAGVKEELLRQSVSGLVSESERFVGQVPAWAAEQ